MGTSQSYYSDSNDNKKKNSPLYPQVIDSNPEALSSSFQSKNPKPSSSLYPTIDMTDLAEKLFPDESAPTAPMESVEEVLVNIPGSIVHLIDKQSSVELASGDLTIVRIRQNQNVVAVLARIGDQIQWPLAKDEAAVKLDDSHYFFSLHVPSYTGEGYGSSDEEEKKNKNKKKKKSQNKGSKKEDEEGGLLNYGLTIASKGQEGTLREFDAILDKYSSFSVQKVSSNSDMLDGSMAKGVSPSELNSEKKKNTMMKDASAAYWTTLAPNVEDYSGSVARAIAAGSGQLIKGILWCGDVTVDRLKWGHDFCKKRTNPCSKQSEVSPETLKRIKRVKRMTKMSEKVATGVLSGVVKVSGFFTSSIVNSKPGKKFFSLLPGEIVLASLDGFSKVCDAAEVAGRNVMSTSSTVTTGLVSHRYGEKAGEATNEGLDAAGHAVGAAWAVFKIRKAFNPKSAIKPTTIVKSAAKAAVAEVKSRK